MISRTVQERQPGSGSHAAHPESILAEIGNQLLLQVAIPVFGQLVQKLRVGVVDLETPCPPLGVGRMISGERPNSSSVFENHPMEVVPGPLLDENPQQFVVAESIDQERSEVELAGDDALVKDEKGLVSQEAS